jgi:DMSO/TMAO reductase YedYZ molybdopterin-dependent catalytic subunit
MKNLLRPRLSHLLILLSSILGGPIRAQVAEQPGIRVEGEVARPVTFHMEDLAKIKRIGVKGKDRDGKEHDYSGVAVADILQQAGVPMGAQLRGDNMTKYLLVRSADGYEILFSLAELDSTFTDHIVLLADSMDGQPLPAAIGPFRIIVPAERKHARWTWKATTFIIRSAKE